MGYGRVGGWKAKGDLPDMTSQLGRREPLDWNTGTISFLKKTDQWVKTKERIIYKAGGEVTAQRAENSQHLSWLCPIQMQKHVPTSFWPEPEYRFMSTMNIWSFKTGQKISD